MSVCCCMNYKRILNFKSSSIDYKLSPETASSVAHFLGKVTENTRATTERPLLAGKGHHNYR